MWQGCSEGEDKHCDGVFSGVPEKTAMAWVTWEVLNSVAVKVEMRATPVPEMIIVVVLWVVRVPKRWTPEG